MTWRQLDQADRLRYEKQRQVPGGPVPCRKDVALTGPGQGSLYDTLGVAPGVSGPDLRRAYMQLIVTAHPDKGGCPEHFHAIQKAYTLLSNPAQRAAYDEQEARAGAGQQPSVPTTSPRGRVLRGANGVTVVMHGQTQGAPTGQSTTGAAAAGRHGAGACSAAASATEGASGIKELTASIAALELRRGGSGGSCGGAPHGGSDQGLAVLTQELAGLYLQRAQAHQRAGRLHHAAFDAQEALALWPGCREGQRLAEELDAGTLGTEAGRQAIPEERLQENNSEDEA